MSDPLIADCLAHPDDDAPRLVWADHVGGERGELVVIQCALARGASLEAAQELAYRRRERELVLRHGVAWAGPLAEYASRWTFRRGFIESVQLAAPRVEVEPPLRNELGARLTFRADTLPRIGLGLGALSPQPLDFSVPLASAPFVDSITVLDEDVDLAPLLPFAKRGLHTTAESFARCDPARWPRQLRALGLNGVQSTPALRALMAQIETLWLLDHELRPADVAEIFDASATLVDVVTNVGEVTPYIGRPWRSLVGPWGLEVLPRLATSYLEYLGLLGDDAHRPLPAEIANLTNLRFLEVDDAGAILAALAAMPTPRPVLPALRVVRAARNTEPELVGEVERRGIRVEIHPRVPAILGHPGALGFHLAPAFRIDDRIFDAWPRDRAVQIGSGAVDVPLPSWTDQTTSLSFPDATTIRARNRGPRIDGLRVDGDLTSTRDLVGDCALTIGGATCRFSR